MKKILLNVSISILAISSTVNAQWTAYDASNLHISSIESVGMLGDSLLAFNDSNTLYMYDYGTQSMLDSSFFAGPGYPSTFITTSPGSGTVVYRFWNGFGGPSWRKKAGMSDVVIASNADLNDRMLYASDGTLYFRKKSEKAVKKSTNDGTNFTTVISNTNSCNLAGVGTDGSVFVSIDADENGGVVTFDSAGLYKSTDMGATWTVVLNYNQADTIEKVEDIRCVGNECYGFVNVLKNNASDEYNGIIYSGDNGNSWTIKSVLSFNGLSETSWGVDASGNVYYSQSGQIYKSTDKGVSYSTFMTGLPAAAFASGVYSVNGTMFTSEGQTLYTIGSSSTGINAVQATISPELYPNPAASSVVFTTDEKLVSGTLNFYDQLGKLVFSSVIKSSRTELFLGHLAPGVYTYSAVKGAIKNSGTFVKE